MPDVPVIDGETRLYAVLGDPVRQVRAPGLLNPLLAASGRRAVVVPVHVRAAALPEVFRGLRDIINLEGLFVTVPHKTAMADLADRLSPAASRIGAANVVRRDADGRWTGDNFDGVGFVRGLENAGHTVEDVAVWMAGAGGAGCAVAAAVLGAGARAVAIHDVDAARTAELVARLERHFPGRARVAGPADVTAAGLVVNATPLGLREEDPLPLDPHLVAAGTVVADIIMEPRVTPLLRAAADRGLAVHHGIHMLECQVDLYREFFGW
ncbi:shikimate dehydrogenase [Micromonospora sp. Llam0]|uniref:shikimate dehydrogenase family protein n=1 Tax=Micromonospora sp. Llam0 TaxID=2485143 RepID=UPI000F48F009|nr:shikimate dehydrogenase [Micromonospora sp. Llam0]ROO59744.1 shikimate dehydrogenase [Micromonospora sp. Llam0]